MKPTRTKQPQRRQAVKPAGTDVVKVFCRAKPLPAGDVSCVRIDSDNTVTLLSPDCNSRNSSREYQYVFRQVFDDGASQKAVYDVVGLPLVESLVQGKNGLLFTYGVTGGGKTFTMTGEPHDGGILPRCLDVLFNSISEFQARKFVFRPDKMNGFDVQNEGDAIIERQKELFAEMIPPKTPKTPRRKNSDEDLSARTPDLTKLSCANPDHTYAIFVTFVEVYNNSVFDLLEDMPDDILRSNRQLQPKLVREDSNHIMYVHGVTELEVKSSDEAFQVFYRGQKRRRMAHTILNAESSRSHSVFTIRLVQAPLDAHGEHPLLDKRRVCVSQLSLVDLAGSERTNRTKNQGKRLKEAGNINNSLMTLRSCLEILRENQTTGSNKLVPYRESKITHLFKNYFDGEGQVVMVVCISQSAADYDETIHVMKFAEMTQEVQVARPDPVAPNLGLDLPIGRRRANQIFKDMQNDYEKENQNMNIPSITNEQSIFSSMQQFPSLELQDPRDDQTLQTLITFLERRQACRQSVCEQFEKRSIEFRNQLMEAERTSVLRQHENDSLKVLMEQEKSRVAEYERLLAEKDTLVAGLQRHLNEKEKALRALELETREKDHRLQLQDIEKRHVEQELADKFIEEKEKITKEMKQKIREEKQYLQHQVREKEEKLHRVKRILADESVRSTPRATPLSSARSESRLFPPSATEHNVVPSQFLTPHVRKHGFMTGRPRRSRSVEGVRSDKWIDHRPAIPTQLTTVLQPQMKKRKSVSKLVDVKDITEAKASKYCLMTQEQDSAGEMETLLYKADVLPTSGGGAQVIFNDVEHLTQSSPTSPRRKRSASVEPVRPADRCAVSLEGHGKKPRV